MLLPATASLLVPNPPDGGQALLGQNVDEIDTLDEVVSDLALKASVEPPPPPPRPCCSCPL